MKKNQIAGRCVLACVFIYLLIQIYYLCKDILPSAEKESWREFVCLFLIQSVFFAVCIFAILIFLFVQEFRRRQASPFEALLLVNSGGKIKKEVLLQERQSFLITGEKNGRRVWIEGIHDTDSDRYLYGVCNLVSGFWYLEVLSEERPMGLKRGAENMIYRLKEGMLYQLAASDVIYADTYKIVIREHNLEGTKWV